MITMFESGSVRLLYLLAIYFNSLDVFKPATSGAVECDALLGGHGQLGLKVGSLLLIFSYNTEFKFR